MYSLLHYLFTLIGALVSGPQRGGTSSYVNESERIQTIQMQMIKIHEHNYTTVQFQGSV